MYHDLVAARLSKMARDYLVDHVDGTRPFVAHAANEARTRASLINLGLVRLSPDKRSTYITDDGRQVLCAILADYADALVRAGHDLAPPKPSAFPIDRSRIVSGRRSDEGAKTGSVEA